MISVNIKIEHPVRKGNRSMMGFGTVVGLYAVAKFCNTCEVLHQPYNACLWIYAKVGHKWQETVQN